LEIDAPEASGPSNGAAVADFTTDVSMIAETAAPAPPEEPIRPPANDPGYVDLFSDLDGSGATDPEVKNDDPFLAAARASLPEDYGAAGGAPDPFGPLRQEPGGAAAGAPPPLPKVPVIPKPPAHKSNAPLALIGAGVVVLVGILAFVLLGEGGKVPAIPAAQVQAAPEPTPAPPPAQEPPPVEPASDAPTPPPDEATPAPSRTAGDDRRPREERRRGSGEAQAREAKERRAREEREAREREARERERERLAAAAVQGDAAGGLSQDQVEAVVRSTRKAFDGCLESARGTGAKLDGRQVTLRLDVQPSGAVTYPTLDDVTLNGTDLGSCLKSAARLMVFPEFKGDTLHVEVPLVLR
jgi:hypothetical protein